MAIRRIKHKGLKQVFETGRSKLVGADVSERAEMIMDHLEWATGLDDCLGVRDFHALKGDRAGEFAMSVSGNWRITFEFDDEAGEFVVLDLEDYH